MYVGVKAATVMCLSVRDPVANRVALKARVAFFMLVFYQTATEHHLCRHIS